MTNISDKDLNDALKKLSVPHQDESKKEQQIKTAMAFFDQDAANLNVIEPSSGSTKKSNIYKLSGLAIAACLLIFISLNYPMKNQDKDASNSGQMSQIASIGNLEKEQKILNEIDQLMNGQFAGIQIENDEITILPIEERFVSNNTPILLDIENNGTQQKIITFNGQEIPLLINGEKYDVSVLIDGNHNLILEGNGFFWSQDMSTDKGENFQLKFQVMEEQNA